MESWRAGKQVMQDEQRVESLNFAPDKKADNLTADANIVG